MRHLILITLIALTCASCSRKKALPTKPKEFPTEIFGAQFGMDSAQVIDSLRERWIVQDTTAKADGILFFEKRPEGVVKYDDIYWDMISVFFTDGKMTTMRFMNAYKTSDEMIAAYDKTIETLSQFYPLRKVRRQSEDIREQHQYLDAQNHMVATCCSRFVSTSGRRLYNVKLEFTK